MTKYLLNAFSLNMLPSGRSWNVHVVPVNLDSAQRYVEDPAVVSAVGHADTAAVLAGLLQHEVACARVTVRLDSGDVALVAQYVGPRLPEGATVLPEGARIDFLYVAID